MSEIGEWTVWALLLCFFVLRKQWIPLPPMCCNTPLLATGSCGGHTCLRMLKDSAKGRAFFAADFIFLLLWAPAWKTEKWQIFPPKKSCFSECSEAEANTVIIQAHMGWHTACLLSFFPPWKGKMLTVYKAGQQKKLLYNVWTSAETCYCVLSGTCKFFLGEAGRGGSVSQAWGGHSWHYLNRNQIPELLSFSLVVSAHVCLLLSCYGATFFPQNTKDRKLYIQIHQLT